MKPLGVEEPLLESAPLAWRMAPQLCYKNPATGEDCSWYHGLWQYLRILRLVTAPEHHADFFREAFGIAAGVTKRLRILISGAADYSTLAHVLWACEEHAVVPETTVVDLCDTPLFLNRWYADRVGHRVDTLRADILGYESPAAFDAVCAHSFFGRFSPKQRHDLIAKWKRLLRPGGLVIAVNRVHAGGKNARIGFIPQQAQAFRAAVVSKVDSLRLSPGVEPQELARLAEAYAMRYRTYPGRSQEELQGLFEASGLKLVQFTCRPGAIAGHAGLSGPTTLEGAQYACIVARKP